MSKTKLSEMNPGGGTNPHDGSGIVTDDSWILKWDGASPSDSTGFSYYTPRDALDDPVGGKVPLGGLALAALFFLLEHSDREFAEEMVKRANILAEKIKTMPDEQTKAKRTVN